MNFFSDIAERFKLLPALGEQLLKSAEAKNTAQRVEQQYQERIKSTVPETPKVQVGDISGGFFGDIAKRFNLPQPIVKPEKPQSFVDTEKAKETGDRFRTILTEIARTFPREGAGAVMEVIERTKGLPPGSLSITPGAGEVLPKEKYGELGPKVEKFLFGDRPVESITKQGEETLKGFGVSEPSAKQFGLPTGLLFLGLDLMPVGGSNVLKLLSKANKADDVKKILISLKEIDNAKITDEVVNTIAKTTDEKTIKGIVEKLKPETPAIPKSLEPLAQEARKYKTAEEFVKAQQIELQNIAKNGTTNPMTGEKVNLSEGNYLYHGTAKNNLNDIADTGLKKGSYFYNKAEFSKNYANRYAKDAVILRTPLEINKFNPKGENHLVWGAPEGVMGSKLEVSFDGGKNWEMLTKSQLTDFYNKAVGKEVGKVPTPPTKLPEAEPIVGKERGFATTVRQAPETPKVVKETLKEQPITYEPTPLSRDLEAGQKRVLESPEKAKDFLYSVDSMDMAKSGGEITSTGVELMRHYAKSKDYLQEINVLENLAEKLTKAGQQINAAKLYTQMSPEGALLKAQRIVNTINKNKFFYQKDIKLTEDIAKNIWETADQMRKATGDAKIELGWELERLFSSLQPAGILKRISTIQTIAQLLNPKTLITRNPLGNEIFFRLERLSKYAATPIDIAKSAITGRERTITFRTVKQGEYWKNWITGWRAGWKGVSPAGLGTQYEIYAPVFKSKWNPLTYLEKTLGASLKSFDFAAYSRAKNITIGEMGYLRALNEGKKGSELTTAAKKYAQEADDNLLQIADEYGKYITFQDNNVISVGLQKLKKGLNVGQDFGLGDLILKYPKTPGALLMRGLEYSPVGFMRSAYLVAQPLLKGKAVNDAEVLMALSRAITGTLGTTGLGWYLADKGIITGETPTDKDVAALEKGVGGGQYRINLSALKRWAMSGFKDTETQKGDTTYSYDWAQPISLSLSLGANASQQMKEAELKKEKKGVLAGVPGTIATSIGGAVETVVEQPVVSGLKRFFGGYDLVGSVEATIESMPSSFTPTILNQVRQVSDPVSRETYDPSMLQRAVNRVKSRIPVLAKELPPKYDTFGNKVKFPTEPSLFNVFLNPGFVSEYKPSDAASLVLQIYNESGETKQFPRVAPKSLVFQGKKIQLDGKQISLFQRDIGKKTELMFGALARSGFTELPNAEKVKVLDYALGKIYQQEKYVIMTLEQKKTLIESLDEKQKEAFVKDLQNALDL